jgi:hypothetical protein
MKGFNFNNLLGFIVPALTVVVVLGSIPLVIIPQLERIQVKSADISKKEDRFKKLETKSQTLDQIDEFELDERVGNVEIAMPSGKNLAPLIEAIKKLSTESHLSLNSIKLKPGRVATTSASTDSKVTTATTPNSAQGANKVVLPTSRTDLLLNVELKGSFKDFQNFLKILERAKRILVVVSSSSTVGNDGTITHSLILNAPFKPLQSKFADVAAEPIPNETEGLRQLYEVLNSDFIEYSKKIEGADCHNCTGVTNPFP